MNATVTYSPFLGGWADHMSNLLSQAQWGPYPFVLTILIIASVSIVNGRRTDTTPLYNAPAWWQPAITRKLEWFATGMKVLAEGRTRSDGEAFRVFTEHGETVVLPNRFTNEIRNNSDLNFRRAILESEIIQSVVRKQLTKHLNVVTAPLSAECNHAVDTAFGDAKEWQEATLKEPILEVVARITSRVFLGEELCRNPRWLTVTKDYTLSAAKAAVKLGAFPRLLRPLVSVLDPTCRQVRADLAEARELISEVLQRRKQLIAQAKEAGDSVPVYDDAITWAEAESKGIPYDPAVFQLGLSFAAIHTTSDLITQTMLFLAEKPQLIDPLRDEMIVVLQNEGWKKSALYNLKLLDSAIKEAQRVKPNSIILMNRVATKDVQLSNGLVIKKGQRTVIDGHTMWSPEMHEDPGVYDIYRFKKMREQPGNEAKAQLVSTHADHPVFGHGRFACPGRFFASNEIKIALCYLLLKYDWKLAPGFTSEPLVVGAHLSANPDTKVLYIRRDEGINLESLSTDGD